MVRRPQYPALRKRDAANHTGNKPMIDGFKRAASPRQNPDIHKGRSLFRFIPLINRQPARQRKKVAEAAGRI